MLPAIAKHPFYVRLVVKRLNQRINDRGWVALNDLLKNTKTKIKVQKIPKESQKILKSKGALIIINHPHFAEVIVALSAIPVRQDVCLLTTDSFYALLPALQKNLIPVHVEHSAAKKKRFINWGRLLYRPAKRLREDAKIFNKQSLSTTASLLDQNNLILMCPQGVQKYDASWYPGVAHILSQVKNRELPIIFMNVIGTTAYDWFRFVPGVSKVLPTIKIQVSSPIFLSSLPKNNPTDFTKHLEKLYRRTFPIKTAVVI